MGNLLSLRSKDFDREEVRSMRRRTANSKVSRREFDIKCHFSGKMLLCYLFASLVPRPFFSAEKGPGTH